MKTIYLFIFFSCIVSTLHAQSSSDEALAYQYYQEGSYDKAAVVLEKLFKQTKDDNYFELYLTSLLKIKKYQEAESMLKQLIRQFPQKLPYQVAMGRVYLERGQIDEANKLFLEVISKVPENEDSIRELANCFYRYEAYDMALNTFIRGRKIMGNEGAFRYELLSIYRLKKDKQNLVNEYLNVLQNDPQLLPQAKQVLSSVFENNSDYQALQSALLKRLQKQPDLEVYNQLLIWQFLQQEAYDMALRQLIAQDKRTKDDGTLLFNTASTFITNKAYLTAVKAYEYLIAKGKTNAYYLASRIQLVNAKFELAISGEYDKPSIVALADEYYSILDEYGKNSKTMFALQRWAYLQAYYLHDLKKAEAALEDCLATPGIKDMDRGRLKLELGDTYVITGQPWEAILIYEQVAKQFENLPIGNDAQYRSARLSFYQGDFAYAKSQADVLKAATAQLIANDALNLSLLISDNLQSKNDSLALKMYASAEMLEFSHQPTLAIAKLDSIDIAYPKNSLADDILMAKAKMYQKNKAYEQAASELKALIEGYSESIWTDDALFMLANLFEKELNDPAKAKTYYQQLIDTYPDSFFITEARKRFRNLRGDNLGT